MSALEEYRFGSDAAVLDGLWILLWIAKVRAVVAAGSSTAALPLPAKPRLPTPLPPAVLTDNQEHGGSGRQPQPPSLIPGRCLHLVSSLRKKKTPPCFLQQQGGICSLGAGGA